MEDKGSGRCPQLSTSGDLVPLHVLKDGWAALPASLPALPFCPVRPQPHGLCLAGSGRWPLPGGPLQSLQKGSRHLASPEDSGGRERRALGGV